MIDEHRPAGVERHGRLHGLAGVAVAVAARRPEQGDVADQVLRPVQLGLGEEVAGQLAELFEEGLETEPRQGKLTIRGLRRVLYG